MADVPNAQTDTTNSQSDAPAADAATAADTSAADTGAEGADDKGDAGDKEASVLGGEGDAAVAGDADKADDKGGADDQPAGAPEKYELSMEGVELDAAMVSEAEPVLRELNLSNDAANKLVPIAAKLVSSTQDRTLSALADAGAQQKKDWLGAFVADKEIGGAKREETEHLAAKGLDALGYGLTGFGDDGKQPHPFRKALTESGFGNHPDMIRAMRKVGELVGEDGSFSRSENTAPKEKSTAERWYGKQGAE